METKNKNTMKVVSGFWIRYESFAEAFKELAEPSLRTIEDRKYLKVSQHVGF